MRQLIRLTVITLVATGITLGLASVAQAQQTSVSEAKQARIKASCSEIKTNLNQLNASDRLLRVNRGQMYESLANKLMDRFNARLNGNRLDAKAMETVTTNYRKQLGTFREHYTAYGQKLTEAIRIDCTSDPVHFYETVEAAREARRQVHDDVKALHALIDDYRRSVGDFLLNYERLSR